MQNVCIKWGNSYSHYFTICNGVRQGGILSPRLFALYVNQLTDRLLSCNAGCYINDICINHFMECIGKLSATIVDSDMCNFIILGDFNSAVDTPFESELVEFCSSYDLIISDYHRYGPDSGQFTYVSDAYNSTSCRDHIIHL